jgi:nucleoside-diphosphate-sugar epimerase
MKTDRKIMLPGGAGLVGQNLICLLKQAGYNNLVVLDKHEKNLAILKELHPEVNAHCVDLAEIGAWDEYFSGAAVVVMLQAQIGDLQQQVFFRNNVQATENILAAMKKFSVPHLVHVSSSVVNSVVDDDYVRSKKAQEECVKLSGIAHVILRPTLMFGWFDRKHLGWLARFMKRVPVFPIPGSGRYLRQPLYARDFCKIILRCIEQQITGNIHDISGQERIDYIDMIRKIKAVNGAKCLILPIPYRLFGFLLKLWALLDKNPPFTEAQLAALVAGDVFEVIDWPKIFSIEATPFDAAIYEVFCDAVYSKIELDF